MEIITSLLAKPYIKVLIVIIVSVIAAKLTNWIFTRIFGRIVKHTKTTLDDQILELLHKPIFYSILLIGLNISVGLIKIPDTIQYLIVGILKTFAVLIWSAAVLKLITVALQWFSKKEKAFRVVQKQTIPLFDNLGKIFIVIGASYFILLAWDVNITAWLASAGIVGIAIGFAAKDTLANLFAGLFIMVDAPYKIGDFINLGTGERGRVTEIGIRSTRILTRDDIEITIPNSVIANAKIVNESGGPYEKQRVRVTVGVAYGSDIDKVREVLMDVAISNENVHKDPEPRVRFRKFGESELVFQLLCWIEEPVLRGRVIDQLNTEIYHRFNRENIKIPFPQRTVHIVNAAKE